MGGNISAPRLLAGLIGIAAACASTAASAGPVQAESAAWRAKVAATLLTVYDSRSTTGAIVRKQAPPADSALLGPRFDAQGEVEADVYYDCGGEAPDAALTAAGVSITASIKLTPFCAVEGWMAPAALPAVAAIAGVSRVALPSYAVMPRHRLPAGLAWQAAASSAGGIDGNGVRIMRAGEFVAQTGTGGGGVTVGVQSVGVSSLSTIQGRGELPAVQVLKPSDGAAPQVGDEGTVLLEEVHAVAPSAGLAYCGPHTFVEYTSCLSRLITAGASILVDDVIFPEHLLASNSSEVQGIEQLLAGNPAVALFTAAGNYNGSYWEGSYAPVALASTGLPSLTCRASGQVDSYVAQFGGSAGQQLRVTQSSSVPVVFAWGDPPNQNASKFDIYWVNSADTTKAGCLSAAAATDDQISQNVNLYAGTYTLYIATPDASAAGKFLKLWIGGDGLTSISKPTGGAIVTPQAFASGSVSVGAVNGSDGVGNAIESFSSIGPITVTFPASARIQAPVLVAPDGINVDAAGTYFASNLFPDGNFYGTSASAPNAGAVAALIRGAFPFLKASQLVSALQSGAVQLGSSLPDPTFGYGRVDALGALATFPVPTITALPDSQLNAGSSTPSYPFTVSGTGALHFTVTSSNTSSIPASIVAAGSPGVTITPSDCGTSTLTCALSITAANGPGGIVKVTLAAVDGANRSAPASMTVTVKGSPTPPLSSASAPGSGGGGRLGWWLISALLLSMGLKRLFHEHAERIGEIVSEGAALHEAGRAIEPQRLRLFHARFQPQPPRPGFGGE